MRHLAAYLLAALNADGSAPTPAAIKSILGSVGVEADDTQLDVLFKRFSGMNIENALREGRTMIASMPSGGGVASGAVAAAGAGPAAAGEAAAPAKEEKKEEPEEESDDDMGFGLFD